VARLEPLLVGGLYPAHHEDRILLKLDQVPPYLVETLVAIEDREFFNHYGVSLKSIARAFWINATAGQLRQGGSTLTQQLVKNFYLTNERSLTRKATEAMMALLLELHYDKNEILEAYLNEVFLGQDGQRAVHGFGLASQYLFSQPLAELKLHQVALMVGMVKGPSYYNPRRFPERALERRNLVLDVLAEQGVVPADQVAAAKLKPLGVTKRGSLADSSFPGFLDLVKRQLREDYREEDLTEEGLRIFTSFDPILQMKAEAALSETLKRLSAGRGKGIDEVEAAMLVTSPESGEVQALIGSRQPRFAGFNRALDAVRPIGSLIKPAVYLAALERPSQYTLTSWLSDTAF
jgi:penicillin-binding protein 1B